MRGGWEEHLDVGRGPERDPEGLVKDGLPQLGGRYMSARFIIRH